MWRIAFMRADYLSLAFRRVTSLFYYEFYGIDVQRPRWFECLEHIKEQFGDALEVLFARESFSKKAKNKVSGCGKNKMQIKNIKS